jgi:hypothetical protein
MIKNGARKNFHSGIFPSGSNFNGRSFAGDDGMLKYVHGKPYCYSSCKSISTVYQFEEKVIVNSMVEREVEGGNVSVR